LAGFQVRIAGSAVQQSAAHARTHCTTACLHSLSLNLAHSAKVSAEVGGGPCLLAGMASLSHLFWKSLSISSLSGSCWEAADTGKGGGCLLSPFSCLAAPA
jgi:hypothetical protein